MQPQKPIIFFDGLCHLCNGFVDYVIQRDPEARFLFASLQGKTAESLLTPDERLHLESIILLQNERKYQASTAVLKVLKELGGIHGGLAFLASLLPRSFRDIIYFWVARHRYGWFGKRELCRLPTNEEKGRLLP